MVVTLKGYEEVAEAGSEAAQQGLDSFVATGLIHVKNSLKQTNLWMRWKKEAAAMERARCQARIHASSFE